VKHVVDEYPLEKMLRSIRSIKKSAVELRNLSGGIEAVDSNADRILASIKMLEINISNMADLVVKDRRR
jgi:CRISPR/Cas system-associated endonuclease Cas3-HD